MNDHDRTVLEPLEQYGIPYSIEMGGKHRAVVFNGHRYTIASTPSDARTALNARSDIVRILRNDGVIKGRPLEPVVLIGDDTEADTRDIADYFEKRHSDVLRDVRNLIGKAKGDRRCKIASFVFNDLTGEHVGHYRLNRTAFVLLVMGFTGQKAFDWKLDYIEAFDRMADYIRGSIAAEHRALVDDHAAVMLRLSDVEAENRAIRADLEASIALQLEHQPVVIIRKAPFVRPSVKRRNKHVHRV